MLELASQCLKTGSRVSVRKAAACRANRRALHQAFWHHGSQDLPFCPLQGGLLPIFEPPADSASLSETIDGSHRLETTIPFLDFLYPLATQKYLRQCIPEGYQRHSHSAAPGSAFISSRQSRRHFASSSDEPKLSRRVRLRKDPFNRSQSQKTVGSETLTPTPTSHVDVQTLLSDLPSPHEVPLSFIREVLRDYAVGGGLLFNHVWAAYELLEDSEKTASLIQQLVIYYSDAQDRKNAQRLLNIAEALKLEQAPPYILGCMISAAIKTGQVETAISLQRQCIKQYAFGDGAHYGTAFLLAELLRTKRWAKAFEVWENLYRSAPSRSAFDSWGHGAFEQIIKMKMYSRTVADLMRFVRKNPMVTKVAVAGAELVDIRKHFIFTLVNTLYQHGLDFAIEDAVDAFVELERVDVIRGNWFESAMRTAMDSIPDPTQKHKHLMQLYLTFRQDTRRFNPSKKLLRRMLSAAIEGGDVASLQILQMDWKRFVAAKLPDTYVGLIMNFFAERGLVKEVERLYQERITEDAIPEARFVYPLLHARARRADPVEAEAVLNQLADEKDFKPDIVCWNIVLQAYQRSDDLDGASELFRRLFSADVQIDAYTFVTYATMFARRGDIESIESIIELATRQGFQEEEKFAEVRVLALINAGQLDKALSEVRRYSEKVDDRCKTSLWNYVASQYALTGATGRTLGILDQMTKANIKFDDMTHASLMRLFITQRKVDRAREVLKRMEHDTTLQPRAFHYAILMSGYTQQRMFESAYRTHSEMLSKRISPTLSSRLALIELNIRAEQSEANSRGTLSSKHQFSVAEELLQEIIETDDRRMLAEERVYLRSSKTFPSSQSYQSSLFDMLFQAYGKGRIFGFIEQMATRNNAAGSPFAGALPLNVCLMLLEVRLKQRSFDDIDDIWKLSLTSASKMLSASAKSTSRQFILSRHADIYVRCLVAGGRRRELVTAVDGLLQKGFALDSRFWNLYVQTLIDNNQYTQAFEFLEQRLMNKFEKWLPSFEGSQEHSKLQGEQIAKLRKQMVTGQYQSGQELLVKANKGVDRNVLRPTLKTLVLVESVLRALQKSSLTERSARERLARLQSIAPKTFRAIRSMPRIDSTVLAALGHRAYTHKNMRVEAQKTFEELPQTEKEMEEMALPA